MRLRSLFLTGYISLAACTPLVEGGQEAQRYSEEQGKALNDKVKDLTTYHPQSPAGKRFIPSSYCYRALMDIICYSQALPGWEDRLVAYQGSVKVKNAPLKSPVDPDTTPDEVNARGINLIPEPTPAPPIGDPFQSGAGAELKPIYVKPPPEVKADDAALMPPP